MINIHELNAPLRHRRATKKYWKAISRAIAKYKKKPSRKNFAESMHEARVELSKTFGKEIMDREIEVRKISER